MINLIVFSYNRPMQLHALLDSIKLHAKDIFKNIDVVYKSDKEFESGYELAKRSGVNFIREGNFKDDIMGCFKYEHTCFAADDDIFFKDIGDLTRTLWDFFTDDVACLSLRLGLNIKYCYSNDKPNELTEYQDFGEFIKWDWRSQQLDFAYPLSVVSHIFRTEEIKELSERENFTCPNDYEGLLQKHLKDVRPNIVSYKESRVVGVPANRVNTVTTNRNGLTNPYTIHDLNEMYLAGKRIDVTKIPDIISAQQEIEYIFK